MTACVNRKHTKKVAAVVTASLVGALSLGVAPVAAMATDSVDMLADPSDVWEGIEFTWNVEADRHGDYVVQAGDQFALTSATDAFGDPVSMSDLTVVYSNGATLSATTPKTAGEYTAYVVNSRINIGVYDATQFETQLQGNGIEFKKQTFKVVAKSLEGSFAYQNDDTADTEFKFTGNPLTVNFADAAGNKLVENEDYTITGIGTVQAAGDYIAVLKGKNEYSGTVTVKFTVDPIDLKNDVFTIAPLESTHGTGSRLFSAGNLVDTTKLLVNGEPLASGVVDAKIVAGVRADGTLVDPVNYGGRDAAKITLKIVANASQVTNAASGLHNILDVDASGEAELLVVNQVVDNFYYDGEAISGDLKFETAKGEAFDPALITAALADGGNSLPVDVTVTKDGETVTEYTEPGTYMVTATVPANADLDYAGSKTIKVTVIARRYSEQPKAFVAIDGKDVKNPVEYDGEAVEPVIAVKAGSATVDPADYTVTYKDAEGNAVESIVEPGEYAGHIDFGEAVIWKNGKQTPVDDIDFTVTVTKATIESAKADKDLYAETGEPVTPVFTAYTNDDLTGLSVEIDPSVTGVTYYKAKLDKGAWWTDEDDKWVKDESSAAIKASDLKAAGHYVAEVTVPADDAHFQGTITSEAFEIGAYAVFSDVDASEWYADSVYNAAKLGYMTGISGTDLFMPKADITRAELAKVFANMAGGADEGFKNPTQFDDVDPVAWYAEPIAWASEAGIVTGYDESTFGPMDKASREQVATMLYRYAKNQGKDVSVDDADAALAAYKDGDQVSDWAKTAMAWAVENGIFGVDTEELYPTENIQRCAVATIAVRFQPEALPEA